MTRCNCISCRRRRAERERRYREANIDKVRARQAVREAIRRGALTRLPCEVCGNPNSEAHHTDYARPLEVHWYCPRCHGHADSLRHQARTEQRG